MNKKRYYIDTFSTDDKAYEEAIKFADKLAVKNNEIKKVILLISTKQANKWFERIYNKAIVKKLFVGTRLNNFLPIFKFETKRNINDNVSQSVIVITCGLDSEDILKIDNFSSIKAIIAIPWTIEGIQQWLKAWNPLELRSNKVAFTVNPNPKCIVMEALEDLTASINIIDIFVHKNDEKKVKKYLFTLYKNNEILESEQIFSYLINRLNWPIASAIKIKELINTINNGKLFDGLEDIDTSLLYAEWAKRCE